MSLASKSLFASLTALVLAAAVHAQAPVVGIGQMGMGQAPVFQANPLLQQQAVNQALLNQAVLNQAAARNAVAAQLGMPAGRLTSTTTPANPLGYPVTAVGGGTGQDPYSTSSSSYPNFYPPYGYYESPVGAFYRGVADLTIAYGRYAQDYQKARLLNQEVERSRLQTRRMIIEEWQYLRSLQPTSEDIRRLDHDRDLARARRDAPIGDILSGKALNVLLSELKQLHGAGRRGPSVTLDEEMMKFVNVSPKHGRNIGFIRDGKIHWPVGLRGDAFAKYRDKIDDTLKDAIRRAATNGRVDAALMKDLNAALKGLDDTLDKVGTELTTAEYMEAKRYIGYLAEGFRALEEPNVENFFNNEYAARGKTVSDLVEYMNRKGLVFVGSFPGNEASYRAAYNWLASYYEALQAGSTR